MATCRPTHELPDSWIATSSWKACRPFPNTGLGPTDECVRSERRGAVRGLVKRRFQTSEWDGSRCFRVSLARLVRWGRESLDDGLLGADSRVCTCVSNGEWDLRFGRHLESHAACIVPYLFHLICGYCFGSALGMFTRCVRVETSCGEVQGKTDLWGEGARRMRLD